MASELETLMSVLQSGGAPSAGLVDALAARVPAFTLPAVLRLSRSADTLGDDERDRLRARIALNAPDPVALYDLTGRPGADGTPFYPPEEQPVTPDTTQAIDTFLETYGHAGNPSEDALLERLIFNPPTDYTAILEQEYPAETDTAASAASGSQDAMIDAFLAKGNPLADTVTSMTAARDGDTPATADPDTPAADAADIVPGHGEQPVIPVVELPDTPADDPLPPPRKDSPLSESLAKIFIRQGKYDKAYEILSHLNLTIPEKSIYFADQLRFLQKLMLLNSHK